VKTRFVPVALFSLFAGLFSVLSIVAQSNLPVRVMAANTTSGNGQSYLDPGIRIFQGLNPDIVCIQEFNYQSDSVADMRAFVDTAFGTSFSYYRETSGSYDIPNGVISRWPIVAAGSWDDSESPNRGYAWAQIDLPGITNDLYVVSVHLLTANASTRNAEATELKSLIQANFPANAWVIVGGDMNTDNRSEAAISTFKTFLSDNPIPTDAESGGDPDTNAGRSAPYDYVLPSFSLTNYQTPSVVGTRTFPKGLVFDSRVYMPLSDVAPVLSGDSGAANMQHMAVVKDFSIPTTIAVTNPPAIIAQPQSQTNNVGGTVTFEVAASGTAPLAYQWRFFGTNIVGATVTNYTLTNLQATNAGDYTVVITNIVGSVTSAVATLTITTGPVITNQPQSLAVNVGDNAVFTVGASGPAPLSYQWRFNAVNLFGATNASYTRTNAQLADAGNYTVVVTNLSGSVTSSVAALTVNQSSSGELVTLAGWNVSGLSAYGISPQPPTTNAANISVVGLTRGAGVGTSGTAAGGAWGGNGFDSVTAIAAIAAQDFATFSIAANAGYTVSFTNISRFDYRRSSGGPPNGVLQYQVGNGSFVDITSLSFSTAGTGASIGAIDLSNIVALQNVPASETVTFRIVNYGASSSGGTWYIFNTANSTAMDLSIDGTVNPIIPPTNPPASAPTLSNTTFFGGQFQFTLTGTATSNYVVQATTNLAGGSWLSVQTNAAPFVFVETNAISSPQRFYRGQVVP
jgi:endonuclease/exonuclease/phosphatase family metal-dependent hydrolase